MNLEEVDLSASDFSMITSMNSMFDGCTNLKELDLSYLDTSNVKDMCAMFCECKNLVNIDLSGFNTLNVEDMSWMFYECNSLNSLDLSNFDTSNVKDMGEMFYGCTNLNSLDLSSFDTSNVENMLRMFSKCSSLKNIDLSGFDTTNAYVQGMFDGCDESIIPDWYKSGNIGNTTEETTEVSYNVDHVDFVHEYDDGYESATITGYDKEGNQVWSFMTDLYPGAQCQSVWEVGLYNDMYVYVANCHVYAVNREDGSSLWHDYDFGGSKLPDSKNCFFDENGYIYVSGAFGPALYVLSPNGDCVYKLEDAGIDFPEIELVDGKVRIYGYDDYIEGSPHEVFVDVSSFTNN